jgi:hypothetical protein
MSAGGTKVVAVGLLVAVVLGPSGCSQGRQTPAVTGTAAEIDHVDRPHYERLKNGMAPVQVANVLGRGRRLEPEEYAKHLGRPLEPGLEIEVYVWGSGDRNIVAVFRNGKLEAKVAHGIR